MLTFLMYILTSYTYFTLLVAHWTNVPMLRPRPPAAVWHVVHVTCRV